MTPLRFYYAPRTCSLAIHIVMRELGMNFTLVEVDLRKKQTSEGEDFLTINPKGQIPYLITHDGLGLSEGPVIAQYLADRVDGTTLLPKAASMERYRVMEWQAYLATEIHKTYTPLFHPAVGLDPRMLFAKILKTRYRLINAALEQGLFLTGKHFTVADAYLFAITRWAVNVGLDLGGLAHLQSFMQRTAARPHVIRALEAEK
ncbi:glutathione transferase GstA [Hydrogenophaga sp.]|uniref:glutathione transferase GstA n=1 Tax=Hydrogenophaga sp. TaxID=1904254 RepID=UPI002FC828A8